jgi:hypothetical protein
MGIIPPKEGTTPEQLTQMFSSRHATEEAEEIKPQTGGSVITEVDPSVNLRNDGLNNSKNASIKQLNATNLKKESATLEQESTSVESQEGIEKPGASIPPLALAARVAQVGWENFTGTMKNAMKAISFAVNPTGAVAAEIQLKKMEMMDGKGGAVGLPGVDAVIPPLPAADSSDSSATSDSPATSPPPSATPPPSSATSRSSIFAVPKLPSLPKVTNPLAGLQVPKLPSLPKIPTLKNPFSTQTGGARDEPLTTEAQIMGATVIALIAGGSLKGLVDYLMPQ